MEPVLRGIGTSKGIATGNVKVIKGIEDALKFQKGDILVTMMTDPAMTPMMAKAAGIICSIGGLTSHSSVLAREMGIPCIVSVKNALDVLKDGMRVSMDGKSGVVSLGERVATAEAPAEAAKPAVAIPATLGKDWIDEFIRGQFIALGSMDLVTLRPFSHVEFHPLFAKEWIDYLKELISAAEKKNIPPKTLASAMPPSEILCQMLFLSTDLKLARIPKEERVKIFAFFQALIDSLGKKDPFNIQGSYILHSQKEIDEILSRQFQKGTEDAARQLGRMFMAGYHLVNGLWSDIYTDNGAENYGAYDVSRRYGDGAVLVIKHLKNLRPVELWPERKGVKHEDVRIYCVYKNVKFSTDLISCHTVYEGDVIQGLVGWRVEADGKQVTSLSEIETMEQNFQEHAVPQWNMLIGLPFEELKQAGLKMRCSVFRKMREMAGLDWKPSTAMQEAVRNKPFDIQKYFKVPKGKEAMMEYWRKVMDPRVDFYPT